MHAADAGSCAGQIFGDPELTAAGLSRPPSDTKTGTEAGSMCVPVTLQPRGKRSSEGFGDAGARMQNDLPGETAAVRQPHSHGRSLSYAMTNPPMRTDGLKWHLVEVKYGSFPASRI